MEAITTIEIAITDKSCDGQSYQSEIIFDGEDFFEVWVRYGSFSTKEAAEKFGNQFHLKLKFDGKELRLCWADGEALLTDHDITVARLSDDAIAKYHSGNIMIDGADFQPVPIRIADFLKVQGLCEGFEAIAYGVH